MKSFKSLHKNALKNIHTQQNKFLIAKIFATLEPHCEEIVSHFYRALLNNASAIKFLNHDTVKNRLRLTLAKWLLDSFSFQETEDDLERYYQYQREIGHIHARIDLPMSLVDHGMGLIKRQVLLVLKDSLLERDELADAMIIAIELLDWSLAVIDESYEHDLVINEKNAQSLKMHISAQNLAFDYERLCTSLSEWMRNLLLLIAQNKYDASMQSTIRHSNFGLWISHKAHLFLAGRPELAVLVTLVDCIDEEMRHLATYSRQQNSLEIEQTLQRLNECISKSIWVLGNIAKDMIEEENGRDPLTHLFNRRYLETVMRHETGYSLENGILFGAVMIDIDHFKRINDMHGHDNGDKVLEQLAELLSRQVRAGDFIFRLGGEEFLIILADVNLAVVQRVAEKIRVVIANNSFKLSDNKTVGITVSIGTAIHDRHPDFNRTLKLADDALYIAKDEGRNRIVAAQQSPMTYGSII
ncbi:MAG: GGDEF domain-containing protein [Methylococcales bacterium]|nr:GGDEF domain-containing protein [Methylococcales bacterium]